LSNCISDELIWTKIRERVDKMRKDYKEGENKDSRLQNRIIIRHNSNDCHSPKFGPGGKRSNNRY